MIVSRCSPKYIKDQASCRGRGEIERERERESESEREREIGRIEGMVTVLCKVTVGVFR